jgi:hypothetical protein
MLTPPTIDQPIEEFYSRYFADFAARHPQLLHADDDPHFWELTDVDRLTDLNKAVKDKLGFPALVLRPFTDEPTDEADNGQQMLSGAFTILLKIDASDWDSIRTARYQARRIALEMLIMMRHDARSGILQQRKIHVERSYPGSDEPVVAGTATGWTYEFDWRLTLLMPKPAW